MQHRSRFFSRRCHPCVSHTSDSCMSLTSDPCMSSTSDPCILCSFEGVQYNDKQGNGHARTSTTGLMLLLGLRLQHLLSNLSRSFRTGCKAVNRHTGQRGGVVVMSCNQAVPAISPDVLGRAAVGISGLNNPKLQCRGVRALECLEWGTQAPHAWQSVFKCGLHEDMLRNHINGPEGAIVHASEGLLYFSASYVSP